MQTLEITCVDISPFDRTPGGITHVAGPNLSRITRSQAVQALDNGSAKFYTSDGMGNSVWVYAVHPKNGEPYITTHPDNSQKNNLLNLRACTR